MKVRTPDEWRKAFMGAPVNIIPMQGDAIVDTMDDLRAFVKRHLETGAGTRLLDIGCGIGRLAAALSTEECEYEGIDVHRGVLKFCRRVFAGFPRTRFRWLNVHSGLYYPEGKLEAKDVVLPYRNGTFDSVTLFSVFTHMTDRDAIRNYLGEIARVLKPEGRILCTWFRSPPNEVCMEESRVVFREEDIREFLKDYEILSDGGGTTTGYHDQWTIVAKPKRPFPQQRSFWNQGIGSLRTRFYS